MVAVVLGRDFSGVQAVVLFGALVFGAANLLVDLAYAWIDPRIRYG
jgi:ABC-type dipeptide/oligopeptide/nickel transport system permease component